jgi:dihydrofolate synthase/folylpolyglutamate synthase
MPRFQTLDTWLAWQEKLHPKKIDPGLDRVKRVYNRLGAKRPAPCVITIAGTNGKGSSVALMESICRAQGLTTGSYTSPHLLRYNERIRINGIEQPDDVICDAFAKIDTARQDETLSYFEFGTLAALEVFNNFSLDIVFLEVGLGGRLDAVNIIDPDVALVTSIALDHTEWLGDNLDSIGREKAGIFRAGRPAICADADPPASLQSVAQTVKAHWLSLNRHFFIESKPDGWSWIGPNNQHRDLPMPALAGSHQLQNAAGVLMALACLPGDIEISREAIEDGLREVSLVARVQFLPGRVDLLLDVSHNEQSARALAEYLAAQPARGKTWAVIGMLADKDSHGFAAAMKAQIDNWYCVGLSCERAKPVVELYRDIRQVAGGTPCVSCDTMAAACDRLQKEVEAGDRLVVCGSFHTVSEWLEQDLKDFQKL